MDKLNVYNRQKIDKVKSLYNQSNGQKLSSQQEYQIKTQGTIKGSNLTQDALSRLDVKSQYSQTRSATRSQHDEILSSVSIGGANMYKKPMDT